MSAAMACSVQWLSGFSYGLAIGLAVIRSEFAEPVAASNAQCHEGRSAAGGHDVPNAKEGCGRHACAVKQRRSPAMRPCSAQWDLLCWK